MKSEKLPTKRVQEWFVEDELFRGVLRSIQNGEIPLTGEAKGRPRLEPGNPLGPPLSNRIEATMTVAQARQRAKDMKDVADVLLEAANFAEGYGQD